MKTRMVMLLLSFSLIGAGLFAYTKLDGLWSDLFNQKHIKPFESGSFREIPEGSVTTEGFENNSKKDWFTWSNDSTANIPKFTEIQAISFHLEQGETFYKTYCLFCHGKDRTVDESGLAATKINQLGMLAPALPTLTPFFDDAYLFLKMENGGTVMPRLGHVVISEKRWQIIGYLRSVEVQREGETQPTDR